MGTSLAVQWLRQPSIIEKVGSAPVWGAKIPHALWAKQNTENRNNAVTNSIKTLK